MLHRDYVIRRLKVDVLPQLPELRRQVLDLNRPERKDYEQAFAVAEQVRASCVQPWGAPSLSRLIPTKTYSATSAEISIVVLPV